MSATYTVEGVVGEPREWEGKYGKNLSYTLALKDVDGVVELSQKPETPAPRVGDQIAGDIQPANGNFPPRFKKEKREGFGGGGGMSPEREKRITRLHSQEMALRFAAATGSLEGLELADRKVIGHILNQQLRPLIDFFDKDTGV